MRYRFGKTNVWAATHVWVNLPLVFTALSGDDIPPSNNLVFHTGIEYATSRRQTHTCYYIGMVPTYILMRNFCVHDTHTISFYQIHTAPNPHEGIPKNEEKKGYQTPLISVAMCRRAPRPGRMPRIAPPVPRPSPNLVTPTNPGIPPW